MNTLTSVGFIALTIIMYVLVFLELRKGIGHTSWEQSRKKSLLNKFLFTIAGWTLLISVLSLAGVFSDFSKFPPRFFFVLIVPLITMIIVTRAAATREILFHIPAKNIVRLQVFRVFVEILLWMLFLQNLLPVQMSFEGRNFDVIAGLTAPFAAYFLANNRTALVIWNLFSLGLLINIVSVAILSMPTPFRVFMNEPAGTIVTVFPFIWLPGLLVPLAYGLHFLSLRQLAVMGTVKASA
jgi:hypothetical protein